MRSILCFLPESDEVSGFRDADEDGDITLWPTAKSLLQKNVNRRVRRINIDAEEVNDARGR